MKTLQVVQMNPVLQMLWSIFPHADVWNNEQFDLFPNHEFDYVVPDYKLAVAVDHYVDSGHRDWCWNNDWRFVEINTRDDIVYARSQIIGTLNRLEVLKTETPSILTPRMDGDAGWDIVTAADCVCGPQSGTDIASDLFLSMPNHLYAVVQARSSTSQRRLLVLPGVIDAGYRGRIYVMAYNLTNEPIHVAKGSRLGQLLFFHRVNHLEVDMVERLRPSSRQERGFGSSGT